MNKTFIVQTFFRTVFMWKSVSFSFRSQINAEKKFVFLAANSIFKVKYKDILVLCLEFSCFLDALKKFKSHFFWPTTHQGKIKSLKCESFNNYPKIISDQRRLNIHLFCLIGVAKNYIPIYMQLTSLKALIFTVIISLIILVFADFFQA